MSISKTLYTLLAILIITATTVQASWWWPFGSDKKSAKDIQAEIEKELPRDASNRTKKYKKNSQEDDALSVDHLKELAENGNTNAMLTLGKIYFEGRAGEEQDYKAAYKYFYDAAMMDNPQAMFNVGICYDAGYGVGRNAEEAIRWYFQAADAGVPEAQANAANAAEARGDYVSALKYLKMLAKHGSTPAMVKVSVFLSAGLGADVDYAEAASYLQEAALKGNVRAQVKLADCYQNGRGVSRDYDEMISWLSLAAQADDPEAQSKLAYCYEIGLGVLKNASQAFSWYRSASETGYAPAFVKLGDCYKNGYGTPMNRQLAFDCYKQAAEQNEAIGEYSLAAAYHDGIGTPRDMVEAAKWMKKAAEHGLSMAQVQLGLFLTGNYPEIKKDLSEAKHWFEKAAEQSDEQGMYQLALCYLTGSGAPHDEEQGQHWLLRSAGKGYQPAIKQAEALGLHL